jgi:hypothetical protein
MGLLAPDGAIAQTEVVDGRTGSKRRYHGRIVTPHPADRRALVDAGYHERAAAGPADPRLGFRCTSCGFGTYFVTCSRCGGTCTREMP